MNWSCLSGIKFKKWVLSVVISLLALLVCVNVMMTCWLLHALHLTPSGIKYIYFVQDGVVINTTTWVYGDLHSSEVNGGAETLYLRGGSEILLSVDESSLSLKPHGLEYRGDYFLMTDVDGSNLLNLTKDSLKAAVKRLEIQGSGNILKTLQAEEIKSLPNSDIKIHSRTNGIDVRSVEAFNAHVSAGNISLKSKGDLRLKGDQIVKLDGNVLIPKIKTVEGSQREVSYQLCVCRDGRIYSVPARLSCLYGNRYCYS